MPAKVKAAIVAKNSQKKDSQVSQGQSQIVRNAATEVVVKLNQKQSLNIVQTSVAASLSTILFIKNVFPVDYYEHRTYNMWSPEFTYSISPSDARSVMKQESDENTVTWDMLVPGKHKHVDKLLFWLKGIEEAIKLQYLSAVVISLHHDTINPGTLAEAWVINFAYKGFGQQPQMDITVGKETVDITLQNQQDMKSLFTRLIRMANANKIDLPDHPAIGMQLTYNDTCPDDYQPPGFRPAPPSKWLDETGATVVGEVDSGYHKLNMRMLPPAKPLPKTRIQPPKELTLDSSPSRSQLMSTPQKGPRKVVHSMVPPKQIAPDTQLVGNGREILQDLEKEVPPKRLAVNGRQVSQEAIGRIFRFKGAEGPNKALLQPMLSQSASMLPVTQGGSSCVCGKDSDGAAHSCQRCGLAQHRTCYGLIENDKVRSFFCYGCLLQKSPALLREMKEICQLRSFLAIIATEGYPVTESELAKPTGYLVKEAKSASTRLAQEGYLTKVHRPNEKKAKAFRKGPLLPPFEFDKSQNERLRKEYWNPAYKMDAYVDTLTSIQTSATTKQPEVARPKALLPTPCSYNSQPQAQPAKKHMELRMDDDDEEDDDLSVSRRRGELSSSSVHGTSSRMGSPAAMPQNGRKRTGEEPQGRTRREKIARLSEPNSPFAL